MPLVTVSEILTDARKRTYGIPCFIGATMEMTLGAVTAAEEISAPLILGYNEAVAPAIPMAAGMSMLVRAAKDARVPVATILDHGTSYDACVKAVRAGSSSVMFDGSHLDYEENIARTREVRRLTEPIGVALEGELGSIGGSSFEFTESAGTRQNFTDPQQAADFVDRTKVNVLAISFGNVHGPYRGDNALDLDIVRQVFQHVAIPLVMHGGSGLADELYPQIIDAGISKINYYTTIARKGALATAELCAQQGGNIIEHMLIARRIEFYHQESKRILQLFRAAGKA
ncbi:class II fructose-bisphosphate aldolase [candidate division KSB1 bacterium]|nr:class II fructose-bisphosphate aldolase [candidate division KSB1 bacterium]